MDYLYHYNKIIINASNRGLKRYFSGYIPGSVEIHHIIPVSCGGSNDIQNKVKLTPREHYICHLLLYYIYKNTKYESKMLMALTSFQSKKLGTHMRDYHMNSHLYEKLRLKAAECISWNNGEKYEYNGKLYTLRQLGKMFGLRRKVIYGRIKFQNMTLEQALKKTIPIKRYNINGKQLRLFEISKEYNIPYKTLKSTIKIHKYDEQWLQEYIEKYHNKHNTTEFNEHGHKLYYYNNEYITVKDICKKYNINKSFLMYRLTNGWDVKTAIETPSKKQTQRQK